MGETQNENVWGEEETRAETKQRETKQDDLEGSHNTKIIPSPIIEVSSTVPIWLNHNIQRRQRTYVEENLEKSLSVLL